MWTQFTNYIAKYSAIIIMILIALTISIILGMRWKINSLNLKLAAQVEETNRVQNNYDASQDTIKTYKDKNGNLVSEKQSYIVKLGELDTKYKNLFTLYTKEKNKEPIVIIEYVTTNEEKITNISTLVSDTSISFIDTARFSKDNYRDIKGTMPYKITYHIKKDLVNKYAFEQALYLSYFLKEKGCENSQVVAFKNSEEIPIKDALNDKEGKDLTYKVKILQVSGNEVKLTPVEIADKYKINDKITTQYKDSIYSYYVGNIVPFQNIKPLIDNKDENTYGELKVYPATIDFKLGMTVQTGLYKDTKTNKPMIYVKSGYPGLIFTNINGADIMQDEVSRKVARQFRREFGIGFNLGYGIFPINNVIKTGFVGSVGINYTPRFLQFGPSKK